MHLCHTRSQYLVLGILHAFYHFLCKFFAHPGIAGIRGHIVVPESAERKGAFCYLKALKVLTPLQRHLFSQFMRDSQSVQHLHAHCHLVFLFRHMPGYWRSKRMRSVQLICPADFHLTSCQLFIFCQSQHKTLSHFFDLFMVFDFLYFLFCNLFKRGLCIVPGLPEIHNHHIFTDALCQHK